MQYADCWCSAKVGKRFAASPIPASMKETISARFDTSSTYSPRVPMAGDHDTKIQ